MKVLLQRVSSASVEIDGAEAGAVRQGYMALVGCRGDDLPEDADRLAVRTAQLRVFEDAEGRMNRSVLDVGGGVLAISQFTLYADLRKGNRPSFAASGPPDAAETLYDRYVAALRSLLGADRVATGRFGAEMRVRLVNEGPCTIELCSEVATSPTASPRPKIPLPRTELVPVTDDALAVRARRIAERTWPKTYRGLISDAQIAYMIERMYAPETIRQEAGRGTVFYLALADGVDAGVCSVDLRPADDGGAELHKLYTLPAYWGRGWGHWLLDELCRRAKESGASRVWLRVNKGNVRAQKAYSAAGFRNVRAVCTDIGGGFVMDDYVFVRRV